MSTAPQTASTTRAADSSGKATASLILGIVAILAFWVPIAGVIAGAIAIVLGSSAKGDIRNRGLRGSGMATAGVTLGVIACLLSVGIFVLALAG